MRTWRQVKKKGVIITPFRSAYALNQEVTLNRGLPPSDEP